MHRVELILLIRNVQKMEMRERAIGGNAKILKLLHALAASLNRINATISYKTLLKYCSLAKLILRLENYFLAFALTKSLNGYF